MPTPYTRLTTAALTTMASSTLGSLKPYQLRQVIEAIERTNYEKGTQSDMSVQPTITAIITALGANNP